MRNPVGMAFEQDSGALWAAVNERDELGSDLVPDYMTAFRGALLVADDVGNAVWRVTASPAVR